MYKIAISVLFFSLASFESKSAMPSSIDVLNSQVAQCFYQTTQGKHAKKRPCNNVIKSKFVSRENKAIALHNRGVINLKMGNIDGALRDFTRAVKINPELVESKEIAALLQGRSNLKAG